MAESLFHQIDSIAERIRNAPRIWIGSDFDGTLVGHDADPAAIVLSDRVRDTLRKLGRHPRSRVAVITGRPLADIRRLVGLDSIAYAGNHGLEIVAHGLELRDTGAIMARDALARTAARLARELANTPNTHLQDKQLTLAIDYYAATPDVRDCVAKAIDNALADAPELFARHGLHGSEVRPVGAGHKGHAARQLWYHQSGPDALPIYLGDELTDEDAFEFLPEGITIRVGADGRPTAARYRLESPREVAEFLDLVCDLLGVLR